MEMLSNFLSGILEILEFILCGGQHEYVEVENGSSKVCLCKKCHKRIVR